MNFKIIGTSGEFPDVLVRAYKETNDGEDEFFVEISAVGSRGHGEQNSDHLFYSNAAFDGWNAARRFIRDFSLQSAEEWCIEHGASY